MGQSTRSTEPNHEGDFTLVDHRGRKYRTRDKQGRAAPQLPFETRAMLRFARDRSDTSITAVRRSVRHLLAMVVVTRVLVILINARAYEV